MQVLDGVLRWQSTCGDVGESSSGIEPPCEIICGIVLCEIRVKRPSCWSFPLTGPERDTEIQHATGHLPD